MIRSVSLWCSTVLLCVACVGLILRKYDQIGPSCMGIPAQCQDQHGWVMSGDGRMAQDAQFRGYQESVHAQYRDMVGRLVMCGVRTCLDGGG